MRPRKAEREQLTALLEQEWDDVDELVAAVYDLAMNALLARDWWILLAAYDTELMAFGPYGTRLKATRAVADIQMRGGNARAAIRKLANTGDMEDEDYA